MTSHYTADEDDAARTSKVGLVEAPQSGGAVTRKVAHGFFVTRNSYQGKHFVLYVPESGPMQRRPHSVTIMRPTTGRNQMERAVCTVSLSIATCIRTVLLSNVRWSLCVVLFVVVLSSAAVLREVPRCYVVGRGALSVDGAARADQQLVEQQQQRERQLALPAPPPVHGLCAEHLERHPERLRPLQCRQ